MSDDIYVMRAICVFCKTPNRLQELAKGCKNPDCNNKLQFEIDYVKKEEG
jgi:hypothetical protein